ncbi:hypothetical protein CBM2585_B50395 [Cupriavidus taiwanensis]|nr:hypothetical protein CBM2585_B50395 [Cupriavidus taiwanensis]
MDVFGAAEDCWHGCFLGFLVCSPLPLAGEGPGERAGAGIPARVTSLMLRPSPPPLSRAREREALARGDGKRQCFHIPAAYAL